MNSETWKNILAPKTVKLFNPHKRKQELRGQFKTSQTKRNKVILIIFSLLTSSKRVSRLDSQIQVDAITTKAVMSKTTVIQSSICTVMILAIQVTHKQVTHSTSKGIA